MTAHVHSPLLSSALTALFVTAYIAAMWALTLMRPRRPTTEPELAAEAKPAAWLPSARVVRWRR